jgi:predicted nucleic acid-binding protein
MARIVLDSSCWLEVFDGSPRAGLYQESAERPADLIVPVITLYEVHKYLRRVKGIDAALNAVAYMEQSDVIDVDAALCLEASINGLPFADSLIYATSQAHGAVLWTQDAHFDGLPGVKYFPKS